MVEELARAVETGVIASAGGRHFGYVTAASSCNDGADSGPTAIRDAVRRPRATRLIGRRCRGEDSPASGTTTGLTVLLRTLLSLLLLLSDGARHSALAAARHEVLSQRGWDVRERGLAESPPISVVVGRLRHVTVDRALRLLGIGASQLVVVDADDQGRMEPEGLRAALAELGGPTIVCAQAGEVNTGSFDPFPQIVEIVRETDAWLHVDGAFGLWAAVSPERRRLVEGVALADSWATDGHKWLNVPYDCGLVFCARPEAHIASMTMKASYFEGQGAWGRDAADWTPESSRRARALTVYAALRSLGRDGLADLVDRCCDRATRFATAVRRSRAASSSTRS